MKKRMLKCFLIFTILSAVIFSKQELELEKVVILSRHGLRSPLTAPGSRLSKITPYPWEEWDVKASYLTKKGAVLETYFGQYINDWLLENKIISSDKCISEDEAIIYTNSLQRTITTGQALVTGIFPGCNIKSQHKMEIGKMDPVFNPVIRSENKIFHEAALKSMDLRKENEKLKNSYTLLSNIIDYGKSEECLKEGKCIFFNEEGKLKVENGKEPGVEGPIRLGTQAVDALLLQYYEGYPLDRIAGNNIDSMEKWKEINKIKDSYGELLFGSRTVAPHISKPLLQYIFKDITETGHKVTVLVGHDSNVVSVLSALGFKEYKLENQIEKTPIGGKIFFEIWKDGNTGERKVKVEYVYQTVDQIRNGERLNRSNPPKHTVLEMKNCKIDREGYCPYPKFISELEKTIKSTE